jgi:hypothetical protein
MENKINFTEAAQQYKTAYDAHYATKDLQKAFVLYERVITEHPVTQEAEYSRAQVQNIVKAVVPRQIIADAMAKLVLTHFEQTVPPDVKLDSDFPLALE